MAKFRLTHIAIWCRLGFEGNISWAILGETMVTKETLLKQGVVEAISDDNFARLDSGRVLNIKLGIDPSTSDLHLGHAVVLRKLKEFQELGHRIILVIGDFTAMIGDPSGRNKLRPVLTEKEVKTNLRSYLDQAKKVIDTRKIKVVFNSKWLGRMNFSSLMVYAQQLSVNQLIEREDFANRLKNKESLMLHELLYPLAQAIDSITLHADVELGGADQKLNLLTGRELQKKFGQKPQDVLTTELMIGTDGQVKMSKSHGNFIGLSESAEQMFGKVMRVPDSLIANYAKLGAWLPENEVEKLLQMPPRQAKEEVAVKIVALYHGEAAAERVRDSFNKTFKEKELDSSLVVDVFLREGTNLLEAVKEVAQISASEATRLISQKAIKLNSEVASDARQELDLTEPIMLQVGKHRFFKLQLRK